MKEIFSLGFIGGAAMGMALSDPGHLVGWSEVAGVLITLILFLLSRKRKWDGMAEALLNTRFSSIHSNIADIRSELSMGNHKFEELYTQNDEIEHRLNDKIDKKVDGLMDQIIDLIKGQKKN